MDISDNFFSLNALTSFFKCLGLVNLTCTFSILFLPSYPIFGSGFSFGLAFLELETF